MNPRSIRRALAALSLIALAPLVACTTGAVSPASAPSSTAAPDAAQASVAAPPGTPALPPQGVGAQGRAYPVVAGSSCAGHGRAEDPGRPVFRREDTLASPARRLLERGLQALTRAWRRAELIGELGLDEARSVPLAVNLLASARRD